MKRLYAIHIIAMLVLFVVVLYFLRQYVNVRMTGSADYGKPSLGLGICSLFFFAFSIFVGLKTVLRLRKTGGLLLAGAGGFFFWSGVMISSPKHISVAEVYWAWYAYIIVAIGLSVIGARKFDKAPLPIASYEDQILDDEL